MGLLANLLHPTLDSRPADRGLKVYNPHEELTDDDILPGIRHRVGDLFTPPGGNEEEAVATP